MIDPDFFGCSGKVDFVETAEYRRSLNNGDPAPDYSVIASEGVLALSVDKVSRCSEDWQTYAEIALNHVLADIQVGFADPTDLLIAYEFGPDAALREERAKAVFAFNKAAADRQLKIGKCHSAFSYGPTAVTISVLGSKPTVTLSEAHSGAVVLERPLGYFKLHYMNVMGLAEDLAQFTTSLTRPRDCIPRGGWAGICDISGHGLLGALLSLAETASIDMRIEVGARLAADPRVLEVPIQCLENSAASYGDAVALVDTRALQLATLRETAGPFVGLREGTGEIADCFGNKTTRSIGTYRKGSGKVEVTWGG
jgi:hypothetical protein